MNPLTPLFALLILFFSLPSNAEVYTWINENGTRVYGDEPPANAQIADLPKIQKLKPLKLPTSEKNPLKNKAHEFEGYSQLNITSPKQEAMIVAGSTGKTTVQLQIKPALQALHEVTLLLDGKPVQRGAQLQFELESLNRGAHLLQVQVKHHGKLLISSPKRRIHVQRPSILNRSSSR